QAADLHLHSFPTRRSSDLATSTSLQNCHDRRETILVALAPSTFLMPISLSFSVVVNDASPHSPRHAIKMASTAKKLKIFANCCSALYCALKKSSRNW